MFLSFKSPQKFSSCWWNPGFSGWANRNIHNGWIVRFFPGGLSSYILHLVTGDFLLRAIAICVGSLHHTLINIRNCGSNQVKNRHLCLGKLSIDEILMEWSGLSTIPVIVENHTWCCIPLRKLISCFTCYFTQFFKWMPLLSHISIHFIWGFPEIGVPPGIIHL